MKKVIIAGSRSFNNYELLKKMCDYYLQNHSVIEIISGGANGADKLGEAYAKERGHGLKVFPAEWDKYGKSAGPKRNRQMAEYAGPDGAVILFWDGFSKGTKSMFDIAKEYKLRVSVTRVKS